MGERKVLNKYYPPDFDPAKIPRRKQPKNQQMKVTMMLPMSVCCRNCKNYIYKGTKFNMRKENVVGENYLGIQILRFYFKCSSCSAEITMKTDPQNSDYTVQFGATRNFEPWRVEDEKVDEVKKKRESEEMGDAMKSLENRTLDSKREMDVLATLDELKSMKSRHAGVNSDNMLAALRRRLDCEEKEKSLHEEDEAIIKSIYRGPKTVIRRIDDEEDEDLHRATNVQKSIYGDSKRQKVGMGLEKLTDSLAGKSIIDNTKGKDTVVGLKTPKNLFKPTFKAPKKVSPMPAHLSCETSAANSDVGKQNAVLLDLAQHYYSDED